MKRFGATNICVILCLALAGLMSQALATATSPGSMTTTRAYFVRAYALVIAGDALATQCPMLRAWPQERLKRHAKTLRALMAERLPIEDVNQAKRIALDLTDRHSSCDDSARSIIDDSLFAAYGLVHSRAEGTEAHIVPPELKDFLAWAQIEIDARRPKPPAIVTAKKKKAPRKRRLDAGFKRYKASVEAYYIERRCKHLRRSDATAYWRLITKAHKRAVAHYGAKPVSRVQSAAARKAKAKANRCGKHTRAQVLAGYGLLNKKRKPRRLRASLTLNSRSADDFQGR
ncbi:MAG: hypothetical protein AAGF81_15570 [Pseudomonadota bacterium]